MRKKKKRLDYHKEANIYSIIIFPVTSILSSEITYQRWPFLIRVFMMKLYYWGKNLFWQILQIFYQLQIFSGYFLLWCNACHLVVTVIHDHCTAWYHTMLCQMEDTSEKLGWAHTGEQLYYARFSIHLS